MEKIDSKLFIYFKYKMEIIIPKELYESLTLIIKYQNTLLLKEIAKDKNWKYNDLKKEFLKDSDMEILIKKYKKKQKLNTKKIDENIEVSVATESVVSVESLVIVESLVSAPPVSVATVSVEPDIKTKKKKKIKINKSLLVEPIAEAAIAEAVIAEAVIAETVIAETVIAEAVIAETVIAETVIAETVIAETVIAETVIAETVIVKTESSVKKKLKKIINNKEIKCHKYIFEGVVFYVNIENNNAYDKNIEFVGRMLGNGINFNEDEKEN
jgi:hypothetical protein